MALVIIPAYVRNRNQLQELKLTIASLARVDAGYDIDYIIVDDGSPRGFKASIEGLADGLQAIVHRNSLKLGKYKAINVGLKAALRRSEHAVIMEQGVFVTQPDSAGWLERFMEQKDLLQGAVVLYDQIEPEMIRTAGKYFSVLRRGFDDLYRYAPIEACNWHPKGDEFIVAPSSSMFQFIPLWRLRQGLYDEQYKQSYGDIDYCIETHKMEMTSNGQLRYPIINNEVVVRTTYDFHISPLEEQNEIHLGDLTHLFSKQQGYDFAGFIDTGLGI